MTLSRPLTVLASLALLLLARAGTAHAEAGSSIDRLPSGDAVGPEFAVSVWAGVLVFLSPVVFVLVRAAVLNALDRRRTARGSDA